MTDFLHELKDILPEEAIRTQEPMSAHTTFAVGGPAAYFVTPETADQLCRVTAACRAAQIPFFVLGKGSNLLVSDQGYAGVVVSTGCLRGIRTEGCILRAGCGASLASLAQEACRAALGGAEFLSGIPGSVGGAVVMNAGAYGSEVRDVLREAEVLTPDGQRLRLAAKELEFGYRHSCIAERGYTVLEAAFALEPADAEAVREKMNELNRRRRERQPLEYPSAGSTFKRPEGYFAGKLIEDAGLAGVQIGGAAVSEKHCGFVINRGGATAEDIWALCRYIQEQVESKFGVHLEPEIKRVGEFVCDS